VEVGVNLFGISTVPHFYVHSEIQQVGNDTAVVITYQFISHK